MIKRHIKRRIGFGLLVLVAVGATLIYIGWFSNLLIVKKIEVRGNSEVTTENIIQVAQVPLNIQLLRVNTKDVIGKINTINQVAGVDVRRGWPETLVIEVRERIPLAITDIPEGRFMVDETGMAYLPVKPDINLPLILGFDNPSRALGIKAWQTFPDWLKAETVSTTVENTETITFLLTSGRKVIWGNIDKSEQKAAVLKVLRRMAGSIYDVSTPEVPVIKP